MSVNVDVKEKLELTISKYGISQNRAAKDIGYSSSALSDYRHGKYTGDNEALEAAILKWIGILERANALKKVPIIETDALLQMTNAITMAHAEVDIALIIADAGSGKTTAAKWYCEKNPRTTVLVNVVKGMNCKILLQEIGGQLGIEAHRMNQQALIGLITSTLADKKMVVILDEADYLKDDALEFSRRLVYDLGNSGLVLIGKPAFRGKILNLRNDHRQLESRIGVYLQLDGLSVKDSRKIARAVWPDAGNDLISEIYKQSGNDVRLFTKIIGRMQNIMALNKLTEPDFDIIEEAAKTIFRR